MRNEYSVLKKAIDEAFLKNFHTSQLTTLLTATL